MLVIVAAIGRNRELGVKNQMLWRLPAELQHFSNLTKGKSVIMGRKTYESIGKLLSKRKNIIVSRNPEYHVHGADTVPSLDVAIQLARNISDVIYVIGGEQIYRQALEYATDMVITHVDAEFPHADKFFPIIDENSWEIISRKHHPQDSQNEFAFEIVEYKRK